jgi:hypothetical protein
MDPRDAYVLEEAKLRKVAIQNLQRDNLEAQTMWRDKQIKAYGNLVQITQEHHYQKSLRMNNRRKIKMNFYKSNMHWPI